MRSLWEINHDMLGEIVRRPEEFVQLLDRVCGGGYFEEDGDKEELWRFGLRFGKMHHNSTPWSEPDLERLKD